MSLRIPRQDPDVLEFLIQEIKRWIKDWNENRSPATEANLRDVLIAKQAYEADDAEPLVQILEAMRDQRTHGLKAKRLRHVRAEIERAKCLLQPLYQLRESKNPAA